MPRALPYGQTLPYGQWAVVEEEDTKFFIDTANVDEIRKRPAPMRDYLVEDELTLTDKGRPQFQ